MIHDDQFRAVSENAGARKKARQLSRRVRRHIQGLLEGIEKAGEIGPVRAGYPGGHEIAEIAQEHVFPPAGVLAFPCDAIRQPADETRQEESLTANLSPSLPILQPSYLLGPAGVERR